MAPKMDPMTTPMKSMKAMKKTAMKGMKAMKAMKKRPAAEARRAPQALHDMIGKRVCQLERCGANRLGRVSGVRTLPDGEQEFWVHLDGFPKHVEFQDEPLKLWEFVFIVPPPVSEGDSDSD